MILLLLLLSVGLIILLTAKFKIHPFLALLAASIFYGLFSGMPFSEVNQSINDGFGGTLGKIGLVIVLGVIIGSFLEHSGGAFKIAEAVLRITGKKRVHETMGIVGFIVSIPVFADSGFIILNSLNKSLTKKAGLSIAGTGTVLMLGLLITHVLVPPTPGPIAAAGILEADVGLVMLVGLIVGAITLIMAIFYSKKYASRFYVDPAPDLTEEVLNERISRAPSIGKSTLPILIPILLIVGKSLWEFNQIPNMEVNFFSKLIGFLGTPTIALIIGMLLSFTLPKNWNPALLSNDGWVGKSMKDSASILLITGAGGIFGTMLQNSGIADQITNLVEGKNLGIWLPFILCAAIKTAQGSSTVALITTASIMAPLMTTLGLETDMQKALTVSAIGAGALVVSHANDSAFWVMTQMSGLDTKTGYKTYTLGTFVVGITAALIIFLFSIFL